ncbi:hypothetical protein [Actinomadura kijaniata]|uniref:hypothetical protein n=1 Tax=Actinomadura kijaniata TaxID=46161 RepID=UPI0008355669|nr:hypothetical protein [Actinomadura kijaniata]
MSWYVLVEANESHGGDNTWNLVAKVPVEGGKEAAIARAEEISRTSLSGSLPKDEGRLVFRTSPTSWLVEKSRLVRERSADPIKHTQHLRVCVAELVFAREPADPPKKGRLRR